MSIMQRIGTRMDAAFVPVLMTLVILAEVATAIAIIVAFPQMIDDMGWFALLPTAFVALVLGGFSTLIVVEVRSIINTRRARTSHHQ